MKTVPHCALGLLLALATGAAHAEIQYISDTLTVSLRSNPVNDAKTVGNPLTSGNPVELVQRSPDGKWARVRFQQYEGWLPASYLQKEQSAHDRLLELQARHDAMLHEQESGSARLQGSEAEIQTLRAAVAQLQSERDSALQQLGDLKMNAAGPERLASSNRALEEKTRQVAIDNERLKSEVDRLQHDQRTDFFFYGGLVVFGGVLVGWLMARQGRRRSTNW